MNGNDFSENSVQRQTEAPGADRGDTARDILNQLETLIHDAQEQTRPLEVDPFRSGLFQLFVNAERSGLIADDSALNVRFEADEESDEVDLSADSVCRLLARRWGLDMAAREAQAMQTRLPADQLERMRLLWSLMRMWIEWTYAWRRWEEFHPHPHVANSPESSEVVPPSI